MITKQNKYIKLKLYDTSIYKRKRNQHKHKKSKNKLTYKTDVNTYDPLYKLAIVLSPCHPASPQLGSPSSPIVHISPLFPLFSHCFPIVIIVFPLFIFPHCSHCFPICTNTHHTPECTVGDILITCG